MAQVPRVKRQLESASTQKAIGASTAEAKATIVTWQSIVNDLECSPDLRSLGVHYRDALQGAISRGDTASQEAALQALGSLAGGISRDLRCAGLLLCLAPGAGGRSGRLCRFSSGGLVGLSRASWT